MFRLYHTNQIDTATFSGGSWQPLLPLRQSLFAKPNPARALNRCHYSRDAVSRRDGANANGAWHSDHRHQPVRGFDLSDHLVHGLGIHGARRHYWIHHGRKLRLIGANTANWLDWMDVGFWLGTGAEIVDPDDQGVDIRHNFPSPQSMRYIKIEFADPTNADGFVEVGYLFIGDVFVPTYNVAPDPTYNRVSLTTMQQAVGGGQYFNRRGSRKRLVVNWQLLLQDEVFGELDQIIRIHDIDRPVYVDLEPDNILASGFTTAFLARMAQLPELRLLEAYIENDTGATIGFEFQQVL